jgi:anti-sigma regulatory factor (Ser/Thr protein kinase)
VAAVTTFATEPAAADASGFRHEALFYRGLAGFVSATLPFIETGMARGEAVLVVTGGERLAKIRAATEPNDLLRLADMDVVGRNPGLIIAAWADFVDTHASSATTLRGIGEPIHPGREPAELAACQLHEELLNLAFDAATPLWLVCPYDTESLPPTVIEHAHAAHPRVMGSDTQHRAAGYRRPDPATMLDRPLPAAPADVATLAFSAEMLANLRAYVSTFSVRAGLPAARADDLVTAVNEVTTNSLRHGGGTGELRVWTEPGRIVCEVADRGHIGDPLVGRRPPPAAAVSGRGVWIANQLCDLVQIRSSAAGTAVRLHVLRGAGSPAAGS